MGGRWRTRRASAELSIFSLLLPFPSSGEATKGSDWPCLAAGNPHPRQPLPGRPKAHALSFPLLICRFTSCLDNFARLYLIKKTSDVFKTPEVWPS